MFSVKVGGVDMLIGFLFGLAIGLVAMCIVGMYYTAKINDLKFRHKIWDE